MATFTMTKEQLATATLECIQARAIELESPLSDEDATLLSNMMNAANVGEVTEEKFNFNVTNIKNTTKEQFDGMLMMARMMSGGAGGGSGVEAQQMATATMSEKKLSPVQMGKGKMFFFFCFFLLILFLDENPHSVWLPSTIYNGMT